MTHALCWCGEILEVVCDVKPCEEYIRVGKSANVRYRCPRHGQNWIQKEVEYTVGAAVERLSQIMHDEWLGTMRDQGYHSTTQPGIKVCNQCRSDLLPWDQIPWEVQERNRRSVRRLLREIGSEERQSKMNSCVVKKVEAIRETLEGISSNLCDLRGECTSVISEVEGGPRGTVGVSCEI